MTERPILFSAPMVRALLAGQKTQTRRVVKPPWKVEPEHGAEFGFRVHRISCRPDECCFADDPPVPGDDEILRCGGHELRFDGVASRSPFGRPGDTLWVRETFRRDDAQGKRQVRYAADHDPWPASVRWRPSIFMPRWASRITLEVTAVRVERLQGITEADAVAEGVETEWTTEAGEHLSCDALTAYRSLWADINGAGSWALNSWVWVVSFRVVQPEVKP